MVFHRGLDRSAWLTTECCDHGLFDVVKVVEDAEIQLGDDHLIYVFRFGVISIFV